MEKQDHHLEKLEETWNSQNQLFSKTTFATEQEIHQLSLSPLEDIQSSSPDKNSGGKYLRVLLNSTLILLSLIIVRDSVTLPFRILLLTLFALSLVHLVLLGYKQLLTHIVDSPRTRLSTLGNLSQRLARLERGPVLHTPSLLPQLATTAACCALFLGSTLWTYQRYSGTNDAPLIAQAMEPNTPSIPAANIQPPSDIDVPSQHHPTLRPQASASLEPPTPETDNDTQTDILHDQLNDVQIICNQPECSVEKYYTLFCEFLNENNNIDVS